MFSRVTCATADCFLLRESLYLPTLLQIAGEMGDGRWEMGVGSWEMGDGSWEIGPIGPIDSPVHMLGCSQSLASPLRTKIGSDRLVATEIDGERLVQNPTLSRNCDVFEVR